MKDLDLTPLLDARQNQLGLEVSGGDAIDAKALGLLAANITLLIFASQSSLHRSIGPITLVLLLVLSSLFDFAALWPRKYSGASVSALDHPEYLTFGPHHLVSQLIADTEAAITKNSRLNKQRSSFVIYSLILTVVSSLVLLMLL